MSTAKSAMYAAIGAGERALAGTRSLTGRAVEGTRSAAGRIGSLPSRLSSPGAVRDLPKVATTIREEARRRTARASQHARVTYADLEKRGERLVKGIARSSKTQQAATQAKTARPKVKATAAAAAADRAASATEASA